MEERLSGIMKPDAGPTPHLRFLRYGDPVLNGSGMERTSRLRENDPCAFDLCTR